MSKFIAAAALVVAAVVGVSACGGGGVSQQRKTEIGDSVVAYAHDHGMALCRGDGGLDMLHELERSVHGTAEAKVLGEAAHQAFLACGDVVAPRSLRA